MATVDSSERDGDSWREVAVKYAEQFGWEIVPLHTRPDLAEEDADDPVIRLLGRSPFVDIPDGARSSPEKIREWTGYPSAALAVLTGTGSSLVAIEIGPAAERGLDETQIEAFRESLPETRCVLGPDRDYYLFSIDGTEEDELKLPRLTRSDGIIFHGEGSLIRVPGPRSKNSVSAFRWGIGLAEEIAPFPTECLSFFGVKTGVDELISWRGQTSPGEKSSSTRTGGEKKTSSHDADPPGTVGGRDFGFGAPEAERQSVGSLSFRSGNELASPADAEDSGIGLRWLSHGALSLLCGQAKTAGKSTFVLNVAAHLAAGRSFLGRDLDPAPVVMLSDLPVSQFQSLLSRIGVDRRARERLHILHPKDAAKASWRSLLTKTYTFAKREQAGLVVFDSLDQFVEAKGGVDSTSNEELVHLLTSEAPGDCAVLATKALSSSPASSIEGAIDRLGLLGRVADVVATMDRAVTDACPTVRRLQFAGRLEAAPTHLLCELIHGRYQKVRRKSKELPISGDGRPAEDLGQWDGSVPEVLQVNSHHDGEEETEAPDS